MNYLLPFAVIIIILIKHANGEAHAKALRGQMIQLEHFLGFRVFFSTFVSFDEQAKKLLY